MALSEIEKLERRYAENPQGLTFAPLAEVLRKNGDVARALELLRPGLTHHPDYIPASIVLGRCHLDLGDLPAAEAAFNHVLGLDGENVIALKALADITERQFRFDEAERLLRTLLAFDRSNDEARDQLGRVEVSRRQAEAASSASPDAVSAIVPESDETPAAEAAPAEAGPDTSNAAGEKAAETGVLPPLPEPPREAVFAWVEGIGTAADEAAPLQLENLDAEGGADASPPEGIEVEEQVTLEEPVEPLSGLVGRDQAYDRADAHGLSDGIHVETAEDIVLQSSGGSEFRVDNASEELLSRPDLGRPEPLLHEAPPVEAETPTEPAEPVEARSTLAPAREADEEQPVYDQASPEPPAEPAMSEPGSGPPATDAEPAPAFAAWSTPVAEPPRHPEPDLVVTESMAELLMRQGHAAEALTVYRHLESRTSDVRFREKVAELERITAGSAYGPAPQTVHVPAPEAAAAAPPETAPAPPAPSYSVHVTHGQSVQVFLRGLLGARPPAAAAPPASAESPRGEAAPEGAPTRPAHDSLSLSSVFGEESTPTPPAVPATGAASTGGQGGVSYDEFFGAPSGSGAPRSQRTPDPKSDDLDQFHAWLQNLKR